MLEENHFMKIGWRIWYKLSQKTIFRKQRYIVCNNDLTDITVTIAGEEYFEEIMSSQN